MEVMWLQNLTVLEDCISIMVVLIWMKWQILSLIVLMVKIAILALDRQQQILTTMVI